MGVIKPQFSKVVYPLLIILITTTSSYAQTGTWTQLTNLAPDYNQGAMLLLTDGSVLCFSNNGTGYGSGWDKLTPDAHGNYANGTWITAASMNEDRLYFSSQVLPNGKVYIAGGEYSSYSNPGGEIYDPDADNWSLCGPIPSGWNILDANSEILPNGTILQSVVDGDGQPDNLIYTPGTNSYTPAPNSIYSHDESAWLKLPDGSILFVGFGSNYSNRYIPSLNKWVNDATVPVQLYDQVGESGAAFMLPNGQAIFFGAMQYNAIYTPSGDTTPGTWTTAADFPIIDGSETGQPDASAAMMVNGKILCAVSPLGADGFVDEFRPPIYFVEYDYIKNAFTQVTNIIPGIGTDSIPGAPDYESGMLCLPDGNILFSFSDTYNSNSYWLYTPGSAALAEGKPTIDSVIPYVCPSYKLTGKLFNGITEGACYGDDWQMETNYPLVRLTNGSNVYYAKTTFWNRIGAVQTRNLKDTVVFTPPASLPAGTYSLVVVANGNPSSPITFIQPEVSVTPTPAFVCMGDSVNLTATGSSAYTWVPSKGLNTNVGSNVMANPTISTTYTITGTNSKGCTATTTVTVTVNTVPAKPIITRSGDTLISSAIQQNQWLLNDTVIQGAINKKYTVIKSGCYSLTTSNSNSTCSNTSDTTCVTITGIEELAVSSEKLLLYPNPSPGQFTIKLNGGQSHFTLEIYNVVGEKIYKSVITNSQISINLSSQPDGMYFAKLESEDAVEIAKIMITK